MFRRLIVLGLVVALVSTLATFAAVRTSSSEVEAQAAPVELSELCLDQFTGMYRVTTSGSCSRGQELLVLPDDYPITLCSSVYDGWFRAPLADGQCQAPNALRLDLPDDLPVNVCYDPYTGRMRPPVPFPDGGCTAGASVLVTFAGGFIVNPDTFQTLGNVDIDVPAGSGVLANDAGLGLEVTGFQNPSDNGGEVNVNPDGSLTYTPPGPAPDAFTGDDTFTYDAEDDEGNSGTATVTIEMLDPVVWFVDANAADPGTGLRLDPLSDINALNDDGNDPDNPGDFIFLYEAEDPYLANFLLEEGQYLIGQNVGLAEFLEDALDGSELMGRGLPGNLPPFMVLPDIDPSAIDPLLLSDGDFALEMDDDSTAAGLVIDGAEAPGVLVDSVENTTINQATVFGGQDLDGIPGIILDAGSLTVVDSFVSGGEGDDTGALGGSGSSLQGLGEGGDGGEGIVVFEGVLNVTGSTVVGGTGGGMDVLSSGRMSSLQGLFFEGGDGAPGILIEFIAQVTIDGESQVIGGTGGDAGTEGGDGGHGIESGILFGPVGQEESSGRDLQGDPIPPEDFPSITVTGASLVEGGDGGDADFAGFGGGGIVTAPFIVSVSESSTVSGGDGGDGSISGFGGPGISIGTFEIFPFETEPAGSTLLGAPVDEITLLSIDSSAVEGGDGGDADNFAGFGGDGVITVLDLFGPTGESGSSLQGNGAESGTVILDVTNATISGGSGGGADDVGGDGGAGMIQFSGFFFPFGSNSSLQGIAPEITIETNVTGSTVTGGNGGAASNGGWGGFGIVDGFPPFAFGEARESEPGERRSQLLGPPPIPAEIINHLTVIDSTVSGGNGADGEDFGGDGGFGIIAAGVGLSGISEGSSLQGDIPTLPGSATISNSTVSGGNGGNSSSEDGGWGGEGVVAFITNLLIDQASNVAGGNGGDGLDFGGDAGFGVVADFTTTSIDNATVTAGDGGNGDLGGLGGEAVAVFETELTVSNGAQITGGDSGDATGEAVPGGDGILAEFAEVLVSDSTITGGVGSAGDGTDGERGGHGVHVLDCLFICNSLVVTNSTVTGGNGGPSDQIGGDGGEGVIVENDSATITGSTITGGNGGEASGGGGEGAAAVLYYQEDDFSYSLVLDTNTLTGGSGEVDQADSLFVEQDGTGSVCVNATGNTPTGDFTLDNSEASGTLGVTQTRLTGVSTENNGVTVNQLGTISPGCSPLAV